MSRRDSNGGAARAAYRIHSALRSLGIDSTMRVMEKGSNDPSVLTGEGPGTFERIKKKIQTYWHDLQSRSWYTDNLETHSFGWESADIIQEINTSNADIIHLHWVSGMLSIEDIGRISKPVVWTMHDMWAFCGAEHYSPEDHEARFKIGYHRSNRPKMEGGPDLNRKVWEIKCKEWSGKGFYIVSSSNWLDNCVCQSWLFRNNDHRVIPLPLDASFPWLPFPKNAAREMLNLPFDKKLVLTGADGGLVNERKGGDLLFAALEELSGRGLKDIELVIFGQEKFDEREWPFPVHWLGAIYDDRILAQAYSAADVMVVPSRQECFGQTATEAMSCGTPVVAFGLGGLFDIVDHQVNGWLAEPLDSSSLAIGIEWVLADEIRHELLSSNSIKTVKNRFSPHLIAEAYVKLYNSILSAAELHG